MKTLNKNLLCLLMIAILVFAGCGPDDDDSSSHGNDGELPVVSGVDFGEDPSSEGLSKDDFTRIAFGGIDDRLNSYPWAMETFDGDGDGVHEVYIGTIANALCLQIPMASFIFEWLEDARPPACWQCDTDHWDPSNWLMYYMENLAGAVIFRGEHMPDGSWEFTRVFEPALSETAGFRGAIKFKDALYMMGASRQGGVVWKSTDGINWEAASDPGVIAEHTGKNKLLRATAVYKGKLYVGTSSPDWSYIYASADPAPGNWEAVNSNGFVQSGAGFHDTVYHSGKSTGGNTSRSLTDRNSSWIPFYYGGEVYSLRITGGTGAGQTRKIFESTGNTLFVTQPWDTKPDATSTYEIFIADAPENGPYYQMAVFNDRVYAAPFNYTTGGELWYSDDPKPGNWTRVIEGGYGREQTEGFMTVQPFCDHLYLGTVVYPGYFSDLEDMMGTEVLRVDADDNIELLVGKTRNPGTPDEIAPLSGYGAGFDYTANVYTWNAAVYDGWLYLGTFDVGGLVLDFTDEIYGGELPDLVENALEMWLGTDKSRWGGFDFYRTANGLDWEPVSLDGFGIRENFGIRSFAGTPWGLIAGVANPYDGFELWLGATD